MKILLSVLKWVFIVIALAIILLIITGNSYIFKGIRVVYFTGHDTAFIDDFDYFENDSIPASKTPQPWPYHNEYNFVSPTAKLLETHKELGSIAFLIIKNDSIWHENYAENYGEHSITNSFSMAKSITSALLGKAIEEGFITSLDQKASDFYPEYAGTDLTVGDLSSMSSGLNWDESYKNPFGVTAKAYYKGDLAKTILGLKVIKEPGQEFEYLSGNTELLAMIIEKATGKKLTDYLYTSFWDKMGAENAALWQVDDKKHRLVKAYCCLGSNARDFARFGKLYKDYGKWNGKQLLDSSFVVKSIKPRFPESLEYGYGFWLTNYKHKNIFAMRGILGQYVIVIPEDDIIIVRLGHHLGARTKTEFTEDFYTYIDEAYKMLEIE